MAADPGVRLVDFCRTGGPPEGRGPRFRYRLVILGGARPGSIRVGVDLFGAEDPPGAYASPYMDIQAAEPETAYLAAVAMLRGHHEGLEAVTRGG